MSETHRPDVAVVGAGLIGLGCAWRLSRRGARVTLVDPNPASGASRAAAGMLAPVTEAHYGEQRLVRLTLAAAARYPDFVAELQDATDIDVGYRRCGTLAVAFDAADHEALTQLHEFQRGLGLETELLSAKAARELEPLLSPRIRGASYAAGDHQVDNRRLAAALLAAIETTGVTLVRDAATAIDACRVHTADGTRIDAGMVVLAAGPWSARFANLPVRPVKGQILRLAGPRELPFLRRTVRGFVSGAPIYVVPRESGEVVVGSTVEEMGFDTTVLAGTVHTLLRDAQTLVPGIAELEFVEAFAGLRPGTPDNAPLVGRLDGIVVATGHYRNGVLLTPITADAVASIVLDDETPAEFADFAPTVPA